MNPNLAVWNDAEEAAAVNTMLACCGARRWAAAMAGLRPISSIAQLSAEADRMWSAMGESDWMEAFACHPRIGEQKAINAPAQSTAWSQEEQACAASAAQRVLADLAESNAVYEERFGFTYIVCATGKSAEEMLAILKHRLANTREPELREAAEQQRQIMQIRLGKWLAS